PEAAPAPEWTGSERAPVATMTRADVPPVAAPEPAAEPAAERAPAEPLVEPPVQPRPAPAAAPERQAERPLPQAQESKAELSGQRKIEPTVEMPAASNTDFDSELLRELESDFAEKPKPEQVKPEDTLSAIFADIIRKHRP